VKDHATLVQAAGALRREGVDLALVMAGSGVGWGNTKLAAAIEAAGVGGRAVLLGERADVPRVLAGLDIAVLCSLSEGFPNALGEAMACGLPCVATDVGDCRFLLGEGGAIVPPRDPAALADALRRLIGLPPEERRALGRIGRARIEREFALPSIAKHYEHLYDRVVRQARARSLSASRPS
jgi:glycosyltransferase involved in cell wall biosynthesis